MSRWNMRPTALGRLRRDEDLDAGDYDGDFWWSATGQIVRWSLFFGLVVFVILYLILGYLHAKRRIAKGLPPLWYHRFLLSRRERAQHDPSFQESIPNYSLYRPDQYGMNAYPPPVYDPNAPAPPSYQPPVGSTKVDPSQTRHEPASNYPISGEPSPEYTPPSRIPPDGTVGASHTGSSSTSSNPYRL